MENLKILVRITRGDEQSLNLSALSMNEVVEKIIEWQLWENQSLSEERFDIEEEKQSGWYYHNTP